MGLDTVPRHFLKLDCDLVQGIVPVGEVYPACAVIHAQSRKEAPFVSDTGHNDSTVIDHVVHLPDLPSSVSKDEWVSSQRPDPSLASLWKEVLKIEKVRDVAQGYFVEGDLLYA